MLEGKGNVNSKVSILLFKILICISNCYVKSENKFSSLACQARHIFDLFVKPSNDKSVIEGLYAHQEQYRAYTGLIHYGEHRRLTLQ